MSISTKGYITISPVLNQRQNEFEILNKITLAIIRSFQSSLYSKNTSNRFQYRSVSFGGESCFFINFQDTQEPVVGSSYRTLQIGYYGDEPDTIQFSIGAWGSSVLIIETVLKKALSLYPLESIFSQATDSDDVFTKIN